MTKYTIYAYEDIYGGLHGMHELAVVEAKSEEDAEFIATEMCENVIDSYSEIIENFEENAFAEGLEEGTEEWDASIEEQWREDKSYEIYKITKETNESIEILDDKFNNDPEGFLEEYCGIHTKIGSI